MWNYKLVKEIKELEELIAKANEKELIIELVKELSDKEHQLKREYISQFKADYQNAVERDIEAYKDIISYCEAITDARRSNTFGNYLAVDEIIRDKYGNEIEDGSIIKLDEPIEIRGEIIDDFTISRIWDGIEWVYTAQYGLGMKEYQFSLANLLRTDRKYSERDYEVVDNLYICE